MHTEIIPLVVAGTELPMRATPRKKDGAIYWAVRKQHKGFSRFGLPIPALDDALPDKVEVAGVPVALEEVLETTYQGQVTHHAPGTRRQGSADLVVDGEDRRFSITLSVREGGLWNIKASVTRQPSKGGGARAVDLADL